MGVKSELSTQASGDRLTDAASVKALKSKPGMALPPTTQRQIALNHSASDNVSSFLSYFYTEEGK